MTEYNNIPENELLLAREVGILQGEKRGKYSAIDDFLIRQVVEYKEYLNHKYQDELISSKQKSWSQIESVIHTDRSERTLRISEELRKKTGSFSRQTFLKIAAMFLLAALLTIFTYQFTVNEPAIVARAGSELSVHTLSDGSTVQLRPHSTLYEVEKATSEVRYKLEGEAFFNVTKRENQRFVVEAGNGIIEVMGTSFNVREWGEETVVFLQEGIVSLSASDGSERITLEPGEASTISDTDKISAPVKTNGEEYTAWQNKELVFENRTAESIFNELEHHYSIEIIAPEHIKNEILGGSLSLESRSVSLHNLELVLGGKFSSIGNDTYQFVD